jgi:hypothetical protein
VYDGNRYQGRHYMMMHATHPCVGLFLVEKCVFAMIALGCERKTHKKRWEIAANEALGWIQHVLAYNFFLGAASVIIALGCNGVCERRALQKLGCFVKKYLLFAISCLF